MTAVMDFPTACGSADAMTEQAVKQKRGFALLTPERRKEISSMGGWAVQSKGTGHRWTEDEANQFSMKGVQKRLDNRKERLNNVGSNGIADAA